MIDESKKIEYWLYFLSVVDNNKKYYRYLTARRLKLARKKLWHDEDFWWDIILRHDGLNSTPEEMQKKSIENYNHMIGNFASWVWQRLVEMGEIKP